MNTKIWYRATRKHIDEFPITRETDQSLFYMWLNKTERRVAKRSDYDNYFPTRAEAKSFLIEQAQKEVARAERMLEYARKDLAEVEAL